MLRQVLFQASAHLVSELLLRRIPIDADQHEIRFRSASAHSEHDFRKARFFADPRRGDDVERRPLMLRDVS